MTAQQMKDAIASARREYIRSRTRELMFQDRNKQDLTYPEAVAIATAEWEGEE